MSRSAIRVCSNGSTATVLQPGGYRLARNEQANAKYLVKYLQNSLIVGRVSTCQNSPSATENRGVLVRNGCAHRVLYISACWKDRTIVLQEGRCFTPATCTRSG